MACFDSSTACYPQSFSPVTYHSYMCKSRGDYTCQKNERLLHTVNYDQLWSSPHKPRNHSKTSQISKLRNILSETISNITKESKLLKGESVELTLEIELMKTQDNTPSNSLVEVTIIQHNKKEEQKMNGIMNSIIPTTKKYLQTEINSSTSESASQKRRNWFQRVISRQNDQKQQNVTTTNKYETDNFSKNKRNTEFNLNQNLVHDSSVVIGKNIPKSNFVKVLPEKIPLDGDFSKGYKRVSPERKTPRKHATCKNPRTGKSDASKKKPLMKKLSDIFLLAKKEDKKGTVKTALTALKKDVDNLKIRTAQEKEGERIVKLEGNILSDMMDTSNNTSTNEIKSKHKAVKYQSFFEPISKSNSTKVKKKLHKKRINSTKEKVVQSHSDTCCVRFQCDSSNLKIKISNSVSDCRVKVDSAETKSLEKGDSTELTSSKKNKDSNKHFKRGQKKNAKGDATNPFDCKVERKQIKEKNQMSDSTKSIIEWNGQTVKINKNIKNKIEMIIVNELENLALKEGMECDVIPLSPFENLSDHPVEKMSSFICEFDISDKKFTKPSKNKSSNETRSTSTKTIVKNLKKDETPLKLKRKHKMQANKGVKTEGQLQGKNTQIISVGKSSIKQCNEGICFIEGDSLSREKGNNHNDVKITYVNTNVKNWSTESTTLKFGSPEKINCCRLDIKKKHNESQIFQIGENNSIYERAISSGFVKKIDSNDSTWNSVWFEASENHVPVQDFSKQQVTVTNTKSTVRFSSATSNDYQSSIEIELDIRDLELILKEAKQKQKSNKVMVSAKCKKESKKQKTVKFTGKNSPSYTNTLLTRAAQSLEKYVKQIRNE